MSTNHPTIPALVLEYRLEDEPFPEAGRRVVFLGSDDMRQALGDPAFTVDDDTEAVLERFRVVALIEQ
jgi:hypothetical protein